MFNVGKTKNIRVKNKTHNAIGTKIHTSTVCVRCAWAYFRVICSLLKILTNAVHKCVDAIAVAVVTGVQCNSLMNCELLKSMNDPVQIRN